MVGSVFMSCTFYVRIISLYNILHVSCLRVPTLKQFYSDVVCLGYLVRCAGAPAMGGGVLEQVKKISAVMRGVATSAWSNQSGHKQSSRLLFHLFCLYLDDIQLHLDWPYFCFLLPQQSGA